MTRSNMQKIGRNQKLYIKEKTIQSKWTNEVNKNLPKEQVQKPGGLPHHQAVSPNLLGRCRPTGEQISGVKSHSHP
jgi:hypothetical protein